MDSTQDKIQLLPSHVANQIAAGEVVQRPCSIIKELIENSVDAGASNIQVVIEDGGMSLIQVVDDGMGMSEADAKKAFLRHATSKIRKAEDLFALHTFGFRGEALASIAAVAQVELRTRRAVDELGVEVTVSGSSQVECNSSSTPKGTNIVVRNLFYNIPARRKFLKTTAYETRLVMTEFQRVALVNPDISFSIRTSPTKAPLVLAAGNLHQRIVGLTTKSMGDKLLPIEVDTPVVRLSGYIGTQAAARKGSSEQYFFVNGRYIGSAYLQKAVVSAYGKLLADGTLPSYFIYIEVEPSSLDVNIHPTKTQVKFSDEQLIWQVLNSAVRQTLGKHNVVPSLDFTNEASFDIPVYNRSSASGSSTIKAPQAGSGRSYNPFLESSRRDEIESAWESTPSIPTFDGDPEKAPFTEMIPSQLLNIDYSDTRAVETIRPVANTSVEVDDYVVESSHFDNDASATQGELDIDVEQKFECIIYNNRYIVITTIDGIVMVDYYRAMGRIAYEKALSNAVGNKQHGERLLQSEMITLSTIDHQTLLDNQEELSRIGIEIGDMGQNTIAIYSLPLNQGVKISAQQILESMLHEINEQGNSLTDNALSRFALSLCKSYYRYGSSNTASNGGITKHAAQLLIEQLLACEEPSLTPDSLPIIEVISPQDISKRFKR